MSVTPSGPIFIVGENPDYSLDLNSVARDDYVVDELMNHIILRLLKNTEYLRKHSNADLEMLTLKTTELKAAIRQNALGIENMRRYSVLVTMENSLKYPFNNSQITVPLVKRPASTSYSVSVETTYAQGSVGEYTVSNKLRNGFKLQYGGSADLVIARCDIQEV